MDLYKVLEELDIKYEQMEHEAVYTVEDVKNIPNKIEGIGCKNLFLTDRKGNYYLVILHEDKTANIKEIANSINSARLSFGNEEELKDILNLERGSVTPFGIINDEDRNVSLIAIDKDLMGKKLLFHPNRNTASLSIAYSDLLKFIKYLNHTHKIILIK